MYLPRFRVRTLLILIVLAGTAIGGYVLLCRSLDYRRRANYFRELEQQADGVLSDLGETGQLPELPGITPPDDGGAHFRAELERVKGMRDDWRRARLRYERAARYPWLAVAPE